MTNSEDRLQAVGRILLWLRLAVVMACVGVVYSTFTGYYGRKGICEKDVRDRASDIVVRSTQAWATQTVASDRAQPEKTRHARSIEASVDRESVRDRMTRIDEPAANWIYSRVRPEVHANIVRYKLDAGKRLDCARDALLP